MTKCLRTVLFACILMWPNAPAVAGGVDISGGGMIITHQYNPWFVGVEQVDFCVEMGTAAEFSLQAEASKLAIRKAVQDWQDVLEKLRPEPTPIKLADGQFKNMTLKFREVEQCDSSVGLKFRLGIVDQDVRDTVGENLKNFVGFAKRLNYDIRTGLSNGYIWIAPDLGVNASEGGSIWDQAGSLYLVAVHELGHVFGLRHPETGGFPGMMAESFPERIVELARSRTRLDYYLQNNSPREMLVNSNIEERVPVCQIIAFDLSVVVSRFHLEFLQAAMPDFPTEDVVRNPQRRLFKLCAVPTNLGTRIKLTLSSTPGGAAGRFPNWVVVSQAELRSEGTVRKIPLSFARYNRVSNGLSLDGGFPDGRSLAGDLFTHSFLSVADIVLTNRPELESSQLFRFRSNRDDSILEFVADNRFFEFRFTDIN